MRISFWMFKGLPSLFAALLLCVTSSASAEEVSYAKRGFYIGVAKTTLGIGGDFDGQSFLHDTTEVIAIPKLADGSGTVIQIGSRADSSAVEFNYTKSSHDATFVGAPTKADFSMWSIDGKWFFLTNHSVQPYLQLGVILYSSLNVKDGAASAGRSGDGQFRGFFGFDYGAGVSYYPIPSVALSAGVAYRYMSFSQARGSYDWKKCENGLSIDGRQVNIGVAYTF